MLRRSCVHFIVPIQCRPSHIVRSVTSSLLLSCFSNSMKYTWQLKIVDVESGCRLSFPSPPTVSTDPRELAECQGPAAVHPLCSPQRSPTIRSLKIKGRILGLDIGVVGV